MKPPELDEMLGVTPPEINVNNFNTGLTSNHLKPENCYTHNFTEALVKDLTGSVQSADNTRFVLCELGLQRKDALIDTAFQARAQSTAKSDHATPPAYSNVAFVDDVTSLPEYLRHWQLRDRAHPQSQYYVKTSLHGRRQKLADPSTTMVYTLEGTGNSEPPSPISKNIVHAPHLSVAMRTL